jgi:hypothetical protein
VSKGKKPKLNFVVTLWSGPRQYSNPWLTITFEVDCNLNNFRIICELVCSLVWCGCYKVVLNDCRWDLKLWSILLIGLYLVLADGHTKFNNCFCMSISNILLVGINVTRNNRCCRWMATLEAISGSRMFESLRFAFQRKGMRLTIWWMWSKNYFYQLLGWRWAVGFEADESTSPIKLIRHALSR